MPLDRVAPLPLPARLQALHQGQHHHHHLEQVLQRAGQVFVDEFAAAAVIDRLLHFSASVNIRGENYRLKDKEGRRFHVTGGQGDWLSGSVGEFETGAQPDSVLSWVILRRAGTRDFETGLDSRGMDVGEE